METNKQNIKIFAIIGRFVEAIWFFRRSVI